MLCLSAGVSIDAIRWEMIPYHTMDVLKHVFFRNLRIFKEFFRFWSELLDGLAVVMMRLVGVVFLGHDELI